MPRLERFARGAALLAVLGVASAAVTAPYVGRSENRPAFIVPTIGSVAAQVGVKVTADRLDEEFTVGVQFSGHLEDVFKLSTYGLSDFRVGARVTVARIAPDRVHIDADELEPPRRQYVRVRIDADGKLIKPAKT